MFCAIERWSMPYRDLDTPAFGGLLDLNCA